MIKKMKVIGNAQIHVNSTVERSFYCYVENHSLQKILLCSYREPLPPLHPSNQELAVNLGQNLFVNNPPGADREK